MVGILQKKMAREERKIAGQRKREGETVGGGRGREEKEGRKREGEKGWGNKRVHVSHYSGLGF